MTPLPKISIATPSFAHWSLMGELADFPLGGENRERGTVDSVEIIKKYADRLTYWVSEPDREQSRTRRVY